jgi:hypothetical protein
MKTFKTHPLNVSYLVVGLVFLGIAGFWALRTTGVVDSADGRWLGPLLLVAAGGVGLAGFAWKSMTGRRHEDPLEIADPAPAFDPYPAYDADYEPTRELNDHDNEGERR